MNASLIDQYKIHETIEDRKEQQDILRVFCKALGLYYQMTDPKCEQDATLYNTKAELVGLAETKNRKNPITKYPDFQIDASKIDNLIKEARRMWTRPVLVVKWLVDDIRYLPLREIAEGWVGQCDLFPTTMTKRGDRQELPDNQYHIPLHLFHRLPKESAE